MKHISGAILVLAISICCLRNTMCGKAARKPQKPMNKLTRHYEIHVNNVQCPYDSLFVHNATCWMKPTNTTSQRWSFDGYLNDGIQLDPLFFKFTLFRKMGNMEYRPFMIINVTADMCSVMNGVTNVFINLFAKQLKTYSNLYQPCPYRGHLYIKEHDLDIEDFPPIVPIGFYYSQFLFYTKYQKADRVVLRTKTHFEIIPKGIERF